MIITPQNINDPLTNNQLQFQLDASRINQSSERFYPDDDNAIVIDKGGDNTTLAVMSSKSLDIYTRGKTTSDERPFDYTLAKTFPFKQEISGLPGDGFTFCFLQISGNGRELICGRRPSRSLQLDGEMTVYTRGHDNEWKEESSRSISWQSEFSFSLGKDGQNQVVVKEPQTTKEPKPKKAKVHPKPLIENFQKVPNGVIVYTQAGFKKALKDWLEGDDHRVAVRGYPKKYPAFVSFSVGYSGYHFVQCTTLYMDQIERILKINNDHFERAAALKDERKVTEASRPLSPSPQKSK